MNKIGILYTISNNKLDGTFTTVLDTYFNLLNYGIKIDFLCLKKDFFPIYNNYKFFIDKYFLKHLKFVDYKDLVNKKYDVIITTANLFKENIIRINCKKLLVLDSMSLYLSIYFGRKDIFIDNIIDSINHENFKILASKFYEKFNYPNYIEYYIKFNEKRLQHIKNNSNNIDKILYTSDSKDTYNNHRSTSRISIHSFKEYHYNRWFLINNDIYFENIGKLMYEYIYLNKRVKYSPKNKNTPEDGLTHYLKLFGVDDSKNLILSNYISKSDIENILFMKENDILLKEVKEYA